jgi:hypothetical protein
MARVDEYLALLRGESNSLETGHPADDAMLALLVHVAFSDGHVDDHELAFLQRVLPGRDEESLRTWVQAACADPIDLIAVAKALPTQDERWKGLRFASRMAWKDGYLAVEEQSLLERLADALALPDGAVERTLQETAPRSTPLEADKIIAALQSMKWSAVQLAGGDLASDDLKEVVPAGAKMVCRVGLENVEMLAVFDHGVVARFREGISFLPWDDIVTYTRGFGLGTSVQLHTEDGQRHTLVDSRLSGIAVLLDRLFGLEREKGEPPVVELMRGDDD